MTLPDVDSFASYGGAKANFSPVEDVTTDLDAVQGNTALCNVAMMTHTATRAFRSFIAAATTGAITDPGAFAHDAVWGNTSAVKPTMAHSATGIFTCTWPTTVSDEGTVINQAATVHTLALRRGWANVEAATGPYFTQVVMTAANVATLYVWDKTGAASDAVGVQFTIFVL